MRLDLARQILVNGASEIPLTGRETALMSVLTHTRHIRVDRVADAMGRGRDDASGIGAVYVLVVRLRQKLAQFGLERLIIAAHGRGYILSQPVEIMVSTHSIMVPAEYRSALERLLETHPEHRTARRVLASFVGG